MLKGTLLQGIVALKAVEFRLGLKKSNLYANFLAGWKCFQAQSKHDIFFQTII